MVTMVTRYICFQLDSKQGKYLQKYDRQDGENTDCHNVILAEMKERA